jgi:hypothetical protein
MNLHETIDAITSAEDADAAFIVAAAINLYSETLRRRHGRRLYGPADVRALFAIMKTLLDAREIELDFRQTSARPTAEEEQAILGSIEEATTEAEDE